MSVLDESSAVPGGQTPTASGDGLPRVTITAFWAHHGEMISALTAGLLLLIAAFLSRQFPQQVVAYHTLVGIAFALGFCYGAAEAWEGLCAYKLDIHFLMVLGAVAAIFVGSAMEGALLLFLFTLSGALEEYAMERTRGALAGLMKLFPKEALLLLPGGQTRLVKLNELRIGDRVLVRPGDQVAADGVVVEGASAVDESAITGEFMPREKTVGMAVFAGTANTNGRLVVEVSKPASDTTLAKIIQLVSSAQEQKAPVERLFDRVGTAYTLCVLAFSLAVMMFFSLGLHYAWNLAAYRAITLLIVASPCALIISTPVVLLSAIATCARHGVVVKGGKHLESLASLRALVFDKTGTLTTGQIQLVGIEYILPAVSPGARLIPSSGSQQHCSDIGPGGAACDLLATGELTVETMLLRAAAALEANSSHPLAGAVMRAAKERSLAIPVASDFVAEAGQRLRGIVEGKPALLGSPALIDGLCHTRTVDRLRQRVGEIERQGQTAVVLYYAGRAALLKFQDTVRADAQMTIRRLHDAGMHPLAMLTGDAKAVAEAVAAKIGLDVVHAQLLPEDKLRIVEELVTAHQFVGMVGDGVNDAPALARATVGIAMGTIGSDSALQAADVVLLSDRIERLPWMVEHARRARRVMRQNLAFSIMVIVALVAFTLAGKVPITLGVIGHEGSTVVVVISGLRLLWSRDG